MPRICLALLVSLFAFAAPAVAQTTDMSSACAAALATYPDGVGTSGGFTVLIQRRQVIANAEQFSNCMAALSALERLVNSTGAELQIQRRQIVPNQAEPSAEPLIQRRQ